MHMDPRQLFGYANASDMLNSHGAKSQTIYVFLCGDSTISWRSMNETITTKSSNHLKILVIHETSIDCVQLRSMVLDIQDKCGLNTLKESPVIFYEDNVTCITQIRDVTLKVIEPSIFL